MKKQLLLISLILISISLLSQNKYFSVNLNIKQDNSNIMPIRVLQDNGTNGIVIEYNFPGISSSNVFASEGQYQFIHIGGFGKMHEVGKPGLPAHSDFVAVPNNATAFLRVIDVEYVKFENFNIHPALKPATDTYGDPEPEFEIDSVLYNTNAFYPKNNIEIAEILNYRGNTFVRVRLCPVQHNPVSGKIRVISKITYEVYFSTSPSFFEDKTLSENLLNIFPNFILNATSVKQEIEQNLINNESKAKSDDRSDIILITNSEFDEAASALALWRRQLGYSVEIVSQPEWTSQEVEEAIHSRYAIWNPAPEFFVIIGDHEDVPGVVLLAPDDNEYASDLYYACMDGAGDYIPDMAHGRISVSDNEEAVRVVEKIIQYEKIRLMIYHFIKMDSIVPCFKMMKTMGMRHVDLHILVRTSETMLFCKDIIPIGFIAVNQTYHPQTIIRDIIQTEKQYPKNYCGQMVLSGTGVRRILLIILMKASSMYFTAIMVIVEEVDGLHHILQHRQ